MNKYLKLIFILTLGLFTFQSCDEDSSVVGGGFDEPDPLVGCEATTFYDWDDFQFETSLDAGASTWLGFELEETTLFSINLNQAGFHCAIFDGCDGALGSPPPNHDFISNGNGQEVGIVTSGIYYLEITNTRPGRLDFQFSISLADIVYGCMNDDAVNYNSDANVDDGSCLLQDCTTDYWVENYGECINDCDGNCAPLDWIGDGWCDMGDWGVYDENGEIVPINLWCEDLDWDGGDCDIIVEECPEGLIEDCNEVCAPASWLGDGFCDDGSYEYNGLQIYFNCEEFNNDEGDCDVLQRSTLERPYPNKRILIND